MDYSICLQPTTLKSSIQEIVSQLGITVKKYSKSDLCRINEIYKQSQYANSPKLYTLLLNGLQYNIDITDLLKLQVWDLNKFESLQQEQLDFLSDVIDASDTTPLSIMNQYIKIISGQYKPIRRTYMNEGISDLLDESEASQARLLIPNRLRSSRDLFRYMNMEIPWEQTVVDDIGYYASEPDELSEDYKNLLPTIQEYLQENKRSILICDTRGNYYPIHKEENINPNDIRSPLQYVDSFSLIQKTLDNPSSQIIDCKSKYSVNEYRNLSAKKYKNLLEQDIYYNLDTCFGILNAHGGVVEKKQLAGIISKASGSRIWMFQETNRFIQYTTTLETLLQHNTIDLSSRGHCFSDEHLVVYELISILPTNLSHFHPMRMNTKYVAPVPKFVKKRFSIVDPWSWSWGKKRRQSNIKKKLKKRRSYRK